MPNGASWPRENEYRTFPAWRRILPREAEKPAEISFDTHYLTAIVKAVGGSGPVTIRFDMANPLAPIAVTIQDTDSNATAVLMPCRK